MPSASQRTRKFRLRGGPPALPRSQDYQRSWRNGSIESQLAIAGDDDVRIHRHFDFIGEGFQFLFEKARRNGGPIERQRKGHDLHSHERDVSAKVPREGYNGSEGRSGQIGTSVGHTYRKLA